MSQLEAHQALGSLQSIQLLHGPPAGPCQLLEQQCVLAHALDGLQQVGGQVQVVPQGLLLVLPGGWRASGSLRVLPPSPAPCTQAHLP